MHARGAVYVDWDHQIASVCCETYPCNERSSREWWRFVTESRACKHAAGILAAFKGRAWVIAIERKDSSNTAS